MPFTSLLLTGVQHKNNLTESHIGVSVEKRDLVGMKNEIFILFKSDGNAPFIQWLRSHQRGRAGCNPECCDGIAFYKTPQSTTICFIELKGGDVAHAVEQIKNTYTTIKEALPEMGISTEIIWKAVIVSTSSKPGNLNNILKPLTDKFNTRRAGYKNVLFKSRGEGKEDITAFIHGPN